MFICACMQEAESLHARMLRLSNGMRPLGLGTCLDDSLTEATQLK